MGQRLVIQLAADPTQDPAAWQAVEACLAGLGATHVRPPQPVLPGIATAVLADEAAARRALEALRRLAGVRAAEIDQPRLAS